jgi:hypothetical protein
MTGLPAGYPEEAFAAFAFLKVRNIIGVDDLKVLELIDFFWYAF